MGGLAALAIVGIGAVLIMRRSGNSEVCDALRQFAVSYSQHGRMSGLCSPVLLHHHLTLHLLASRPANCLCNSFIMICDLGSTWR